MCGDSKGEELTSCAFIFARGGSKGLPGKNIRELAGVPLLAHSIRTAQQVERIGKIYVSTEDAEIARVARAFGADVIDRPAELASDTAPEWLAWRHAIDEVFARDGVFDVFLSLPATSPLRSVNDVNACLDALDASTDVVVTVTPAARSPYFNMVTRSPEGESRLVIEGHPAARRQDVPTVYDLTTVAYVTRPEFIRTHDRLFDGRVRSVIIPKTRAVDIDDIHDFQFAEVLVQAGQK